MDATHNVPQGADYNYQYRKWNSGTPESYPQFTRHYSRLFDAALTGLAPDTPVLDLGCGTGYLVHALRALGYAGTHGIDVSADQVAVGRRLDLPLEQVGDPQAWLLARPGRYQAIFCLDVIEHVALESQLPLLRAVRAALLPGGLLVCTVPNASSAGAARMRYGDLTHVTCYTEDSLDSLLHYAGFESIVIGDAEYAPRLPFIPRPSVALWWLKCGFRMIRRLEMMAEFGAAEGRRMPLARNLKACARASRSEAPW